MKVDELLAGARDAITVGRVYGEPYERNGTTVIPAAAVMGGSGGGGGHDSEGQEGEGGGFGIRARPAGAYVIRNGEVKWQPAIDINRLVSSVTLLAVVWLLTRGRLIKLRAKYARKGKD